MILEAPLCYSNVIYNYKIVLVIQFVSQSQYSNKRSQHNYLNNTQYSQVANITILNSIQ